MTEPPTETTSATARLSPDRPAVATFTLLLVAIIMAASYAYSFVAIADAAAWAWADHGPWVRWLAPVFIDGAIVTYTLSLAIVRWRGEPARRTLFFLGTFTGISVLVNFAHAGGARAWDFGQLETWFASLIGVAAPLAALFAADEATRLVFTRAPAAVSEPQCEPAVAELAVDPVDVPDEETPEQDHPREIDQATFQHGRDFKLQGGNFVSSTTAT